MKEFKDFSADKTFPITRDQTFTPVYRNFNENMLTKFGVFIAEFLYPPILIEDVVQKPEVEQKTNSTPNLLVFSVLLSILVGIICGTWWYVIYRQRKRLNQNPLSLGLPELNDNEQELTRVRSVHEQEKEEPPAPSLAIEENIAVNESNEPVIDAVPIEVTDIGETAMKVKCDSEIMPSSCDDKKIVPSEPDGHKEEISKEPVGKTERIVRKRFARQPMDRNKVTAKTEPMARKSTVRKPNTPEPVTRKIKTDRK